MRDIVQKTTQKTTYKDYQSYLQSYKNGNSSGSLSQTSSTSSLQSTENERIQHDLQKNYIENNNNKFTGVVINDKKKEEVKKPTMKSELFITINQPNVETFYQQKQTTTSSTNKFSEIKQRFNGGCSSNKVNNQNSKIQYANQNNQNYKHQTQNQKSPISPKSAENNVVSDQMIYAKTAVLEELLTTSPTLKRVPPTFPMEAPKNFNSAPKPPPLPTSKPPSVQPPSLPATKPPSLPATKPPSLPTTKPPNLPTTKPHIAPKINQQVDNQNLSSEQLLKELQTLMLMHEKANSLATEQPNPTTVVPVAEGVSDVDKGDPNVKTLVYNTYRGMLGGYNNKANNLVSTLPRNAVVQDQGVARQVESMASQGCLNNINGRVNPKASED